MSKHAKTNPGISPQEWFDSLTTNPPEYITADVETVSTKDQTPLGVGICTPDMNVCYVPIGEPDFPWKLFSKHSPTRIIWYNAPFDLSRKAFGQYKVVDLEKTDDAIICVRNRGFADNTLEYVSSNVQCNYSARSMRSVLAEHKAKVVTDLPDNIVAEKCMEDAQATMWAWETYRPMMSDDIYEREREFLITLLTMSHTGIKKDQERLEAIDRELEARILTLQGHLDYYGVNPNSNQQVGVLLNELGYWLPMTRKGNYSTKAANLEKIDHPVSALILTSRKFRKLHNTYTHPWLSEVRIYSQFKMDAATGRTMAADYNVQNIPTGYRQGAINPRAGSIRSVFVPDHPLGTKWDLKQIELRVLAYLSGDDAMMDILNQPDGDLHDETMAVCHSFGYMISRTEAKNFNFGMCYGGSNEVLAEFTKINDDRVLDMLRNAWITRFPIAWAWIQAQRDKADHNLMTETMFGRPLNIELTVKGINSDKHVRNCMVNYPIQGSAAEIFKIVANEITTHVIPREYHRSQIHDEFWEDGDWQIPSEIEHCIDGLWTPIEQEIVTRYG